MVDELVDEWVPFWVIYTVHLRCKSSFDSLVIRQGFQALDLAFQVAVAGFRLVWENR
jgi:hypothetical protein